MGRALISHLSTNDINKSLMGNGGERDGASAKSVARKPQGCYGAEPYQKLSSVPRPNYVFCGQVDISGDKVVEKSLY